MSNRNVNLDLVKVLASIGVVGLHAIGMVNYSIYYFCDFAVPLFMMVNGYLMFNKSGITPAYAFTKILSLLKIVVCWNLLIILPVMVLRHKFVNPIRLCVNCLFQKGYLWHFWYFGALIIIYLALPLIHHLIKNRPLLHLILVVILVLISVTISIMSMVRGYSIQKYVPQTLRIWTWLMFFLFGGLCTTSYFDKLLNIPLWLHSVLTAVFAFVNNIVEKKVGLYLIHERIADLFYDDITSIIWYCLLFTLLLRVPLSALVKKAATRIEPLTLGIFIIHPILLAGASSVYTPSGTLSAVIFFVLITLLSGIVSFIMRRVVIIRELIRL
ncbi:MAG: acyltransferase family protein [Lachnospiraceae bacterium]|nr:acyltransferase family protein [Lachnospiraceae bacterium]MCI7557109.1 acyltransferase family protein [Lachnospiraceae bacterium]